ncbi:MAG: hypothetical protein SF339_18735 [Blastocatellia bacterium]|nr:hypothetical protein [Blastocatellia bacterium]
MSSLELEEKVAFLSQPEVYPIATARVEVRETHMSWVFLTDAQAWKLKKPVRYDFLDFSTLDARRRNCEEEVRLNRRLAPSVYLGTVALTRDREGQLHLNRTGEIVDWLVRMRRLPEERMLDGMIAAQTVLDADLRRVGQLLARFYKHASPAEITATEYRRRLTMDVRADQQELLKPEYDLPLNLVRSITEAQLKFLEQEAGMLDDRVRTGMIIEAHGDLRPEHICIETPPVIIDCLEFNRDFRLLDAASELAFLALECERLGAAHVGDFILETVRSETGDRPSQRLIAFYKSFHACLRAKIALWHLRDDRGGNPAKWIAKARAYLQLAAGASNSTIDPPA